MGDPVLMLRTQGGFANRLRAILSAVLWAEDLGRKLAIYWPVEPGHMPCALGEIFQDVSIPRLCCVHAGYLPKAHAVQSVQDMEAVVGVFGGQEELRIESYSGFHPELYTHRGKVLLRGLRFREKVEALAAQLWKEVRGDSTWIGLHYRGTDHTKCKKACTPEQLAEKVRDWLVVEPGQKFWLATDEHAVQKAFLEWFPGSIESPILVKSRQHPEGQLLAIAEWLCLTRCQAVWGSVGSTFSQWAAIRSGANYEAVGA